MERRDLLQKWEGFVEEIHSDSFVARLVDLTDPNHPEEEAEILKSALDSKEYEFIREGAFFDWEIFDNGGVGLSVIKFKRGPIITEQDIEEARIRAQEIIRRLKFL